MLEPVVDRLVRPVATLILKKASWLSHLFGRSDRHTDTRTFGGAGARLDLLERAAIFDRHHLDEARAITLPTRQDRLGLGALGEACMARDKPVQELRVALREAAHHVDEAMR